LLKQNIEKADPHRDLTTAEIKRFAKLEAIADKLKRGENVQNRQLQTWLSEDECAQTERVVRNELESEFKCHTNQCVISLQLLSGNKLNFCTFKRM